MEIYSSRERSIKVRFMSEKALQNYLMLRAKTEGVYARKMQAVGRVGFPDVLIAHKGVVVFIELKSPSGKGRLSEMQIWEHTQLRSAGCDIRVISTKNEIENVITHIIEV